MSFLVLLSSLSSWCLVAVIVLLLFPAVPWVGLQCLIMVFPDHMLTYSFGSKLYRQIVGIPMGTYCAPFVADFFLFCYERGIMLF